MNDDLIRQLSELMDALRAEADEVARAAPHNRRDKMRYASMFAKDSSAIAHARGAAYLLRCFVDARPPQAPFCGWRLARPVFSSILIQVSAARCLYLLCYGSSHF